MKKLSLVMGVCLVGIAQAEPRPLPPIINNSSYASGGAYSSRAPSNQPMLEMLGRVESLQTEIQQLRGLLEQQSNEINNLKKRQQNIYTDMNARLQYLETGRKVSENVAEQENLAIPVAQRAKAIPPVKVVKKPRPKSKASEKADFDKAFASVKNSHYHEAIKLFQQFLEDYPGGEYSDNATFWLGSVYKVVNNMPEAKKSFQAVFTQFPKSEKAALAMLKLGDIYLAENNRSKAEQLYHQIKAQYAGTTSAHMAEKKLQSIGQ